MTASLSGARILATPTSQSVAEPLEWRLRRARMGRQSQLLRWLCLLLEMLLVLLFFVPTGGGEPGSAQGDGSSSLFRIAILAMLPVAGLAILSKLGRSLHLLRQSWPILAIFLWFFASAAWAPHADLTVTRTVAYIMIFLIAVALAASFDHPTDFQRPIYCGLLLIFLLNVVAAHSFAPVEPGMGINGLYAQKNGAGAVALYTIIVATFSIVLASRLSTRVLSIVFVAAAWVFLISTRAKTSTGIAILLTATLPFIGFALSQAKPYKLFAGVVGTSLLGVGLFAYQLSNYSGEELELAIFGDLTFTDRTYIWDALYPEIGMRPWNGYGFGSFWATGEPLNPISTVNNDVWFKQAELINEAHNGYIDITLQTGFVGLAIFLFIILRCIWVLCAAISAPTTGRRGRIACTMMLGLVLAFVLGNLTESLIFQPSNPVGYLFVLIAVQAERWKTGVGTPSPGQRRRI